VIDEEEKKGEEEEEEERRNASRRRESGGWEESRGARWMEREVWRGDGAERVAEARREVRGG